MGRVYSCMLSACLCSKHCMNICMLSACVCSTHCVGRFMLVCCQRVYVVHIMWTDVQLYVFSLRVYVYTLCGQIYGRCGERVLLTVHNPSANLTFRHFLSFSKIYLQPPFNPFLRSLHHFLSFCKIHFQSVLIVLQDLSLATF